MEKRPDIIALTETWLYQTIMGSEVDIPDFRSFRRDRTCHGGGLAIYTSESKVAANLELMSVVLATTHGSTLVCLHYRPPDAGPSLHDLESALLNFDVASYSDCLLVGLISSMSLYWPLMSWEWRLGLGCAKFCVRLQGQHCNPAR